MIFTYDIGSVAVVKTGLSYPIHNKFVCFIVRRGVVSFLDFHNKQIYWESDQ